MALIRKVGIRRFKGLGGVDIPNCRRLNIFVGKNNAGKSQKRDLGASYCWAPREPRRAGPENRMGGALRGRTPSGSRLRSIPAAIWITS